MGSYYSFCCGNESEENIETYKDFRTSDLEPLPKGNIIWYTELQDMTYNVESIITSRESHGITQNISQKT